MDEVAIRARRGQGGRRTSSAGLRPYYSPCGAGGGFEPEQIADVAATRRNEADLKAHGASQATSRPRASGADGVVPSDERSQTLLAVATRAKRQRSRSSFLPPEGLLVYSVFVSELRVTVLLELDANLGGTAAIAGPNPLLVFKTVLSGLTASGKPELSVGTTATATAEEVFGRSELLQMWPGLHVESFL